jgi:hypothetical protein
MSGLSGQRLEVGEETWEVTSKLLGKGGFASVYEARSAGGQTAAVKVVDLKQSTSWAISKLCIEAENLRRAQMHEHVVRFIGDVRLGDAYHAFFFEAWGQDLLDTVLELRGLGEERALNITAQVMRALAWLHEKRICHGCAASLPAPPRACARDTPQTPGELCGACLTHIPPLPPFPPSLPFIRGACCSQGRQA